MSTQPEVLRADDWHALPTADVLQRVESDGEGLSLAEAQARLQRYGRNSLPQQRAVTWWEILIRQFQSPLIYILAIAAVFSVAIGDMTDAAFIVVVLLLNALIGGYQEMRAEQSSRALQQLLRVRATVMRDGELREVDAEEVVPGDVVWLESGNRVPADLRLISDHGLEVNESLLTGESLGVHKESGPVLDAAIPVADRTNMVHAATTVVRGRGKGVVVATGQHTAVGQLAEAVLGADRGVPPLLLRMERFSRIVGIVMVVVALVIATIGVLVRGYEVGEMVLFAIALAVSAIPEGLPAALTVALAIGATRMARRGVIIRRLAAVEGLGSCTLIGSDKTGTLTVNELTVREVRLADGVTLQITGEGFEPAGEVQVDGRAIASGEQATADALALAVVLCNEGDLHRRDGEWIWRGDPTDIALLAFGHKLGCSRAAMLDRLPQFNEIPFEAEHRYSATFHRDGAATRVFVKGAPERIISMCRWEQPGDEARWQEAAQDMAARGLRVLAIADGDAPAELTESQAPPEPAGLRFLGLTGMIDPLRSGVRDAVHACHDAGITVCMITGDHPVTALAIARDLDLADSAEQVITGAQLSGLSNDELREALGRIRVFARVSPQQKLQLVEAARNAGHFVAVTGDGVNDAPALRVANIGVAMGKAGTDVARDASDLVISDDNFATIVGGVEEGRVAFDNVRKVIHLLVSCGAAELIALGCGILIGLPLLLLPVQILWLNVVTNGLQGVALAFEPNEGGVLKRRPRPPKESILNRLMIERLLVTGIVMAAVMLVAFWWMLDHGWSEREARNALLLLMVLFENVHIGNCRSERKSAFALSPLRSPPLLAGALFALMLHVVSMHVPFGQRILQTEPVSLETWAVLIALSLTILVAVEIHKFTWRLRFPDD